MSERGSAGLELVLGACLLLLPTLMLVSVLPVWSERQVVAASVAREAARAFVLAPSASEGDRAARRMADQIARDHGHPPGAYSLRLSGGWRRGGSVTAQVRTIVPALRVPLIGRVGRLVISVEHTEQRDPYRSA